MDRKEMLLSHEVKYGQTSNASYYQMRPGTDMKSNILNQDNAPPHRAHLITFDFIGLERIVHRPYSPDLAPMDFAVFPRLKNTNDIQTQFLSFVKNWSSDRYRDIYDTLIKRQCIAYNI
ncbi:SETMR-like protein [Mya arenaria]|uniref:SETMR-like protein n=1 Tax=Mya arenaria TaxID=6604 RepID=A0ABY7FPA2_MYAAR|nr:SETMR-like protein [Mya arenaria]